MAELVDKAPELPPPFVNVTGIANFRDIGGYSTSSEQQQSIRSGLVYRCADPTKVQPDGLAKLKELGVKKVFDLRSVPEISKQGPEWAGVAVEKQVFTTRAEGDETPVGADEIERIWCPVFKDTDYGPEQVAIRFQYYASGSEVCTSPLRLPLVGIQTNPRAITGFRKSILRHHDTRQNRIQDHPHASGSTKPFSVYNPLHGRKRPHRHHSRPLVPPLLCALRHSC